MWPVLIVVHSKMIPIIIMSAFLWGSITEKFVITSASSS